MTTVSVIYPRGEGAHFDFDYYEKTHLPLVRKTWGERLTSAKALRGTAATDGGDSPFLAIALMSFPSSGAMNAAMSGEGAAAILGDIRNFTNVKPIVQINEPIGGG